MTVFMVVSVDKYELPLAVGETYAECAKVFGVDPAALCRAYKSGNISVRRSDGTLYRVIKVDIGGPPHKQIHKRKGVKNDGINT